MSENARQERDIVELSMESFCKEIVDMTLDGWAISPTNPGDAMPMCNTFTVSMYRDADTVERFRASSSGVGEKPKLTRAEILEKARQAKKDKLSVSTQIIE